MGTNAHRISLFSFKIIIREYSPKNPNSFLHLNSTSVTLLIKIWLKLIMVPNNIKIKQSTTRIVISNTLFFSRLNTFLEFGPHLTSPRKSCLDTSFWTHHLSTHTEEYILFDYFKNKYCLIIFFFILFQLCICLNLVTNFSSLRP